MLFYPDEVTREDTEEGEKLRDDDLVLMVDAYDIWFQLPPDILLYRYHQTTRTSNARLAEQWGGYEDMPMNTTIILSTQKKCYPPPESMSNLHCGALPESPLKNDLYGFNTDMNPELDPNGYHNVRPKFLNSGSIMGPVGDLRRYLRRVKERLDTKLINAKHEHEIYSDQGIFGEIFGEQEIWRQWRLERHQSQDEDLPQNEGTAMIEQDFEYHVGLSYWQDLFVTTVFGEVDGDFVLLSNTSDIEEHSQQLNITPTRLLGMPEDMMKATKPFGDLLVGDADQGPEWSDVPLYADFFTTSIPAILHHNAHKDGLKEKRVWWWDRTWYFLRLRELLSARLVPRKLLPLTRLPAIGGDLIYWPLLADAKNRLPRIFSPGTAKKGLAIGQFEDLCRYPDEKAGSEQHWFDEVFRDGKGAI